MSVPVGTDGQYEFPSDGLDIKRTSNKRARFSIPSNHGRASSSSSSKTNTTHIAKTSAASSGSRSASACFSQLNSNPSAGVIDLDDDTDEPPKIAKTTSIVMEDDFAADEEAARELGNGDDE